MSSVYFSSATSSVNKNGTSVNIAVTCDPAAPAGGCSVDWATADGTAQSVTYGLGKNFTADSDTLSFAESETTKNITITIENNPVVNLDLDFTVTLSNPVNCTLGGTTLNTCTIVDNAMVEVLDVKTPGHGLSGAAGDGPDDGFTDDTAALQAIFDYADANGNGYVIQFPTGTYMVDPDTYYWCLRAYCGDTYRNKPGETPVIKRINTAPAETSAQNLLANNQGAAPESQSPIGLYGINFDNSGQLTDEQSPCVRTGGIPGASGERWIWRIQSCDFQSWVDDIVDGTAGKADAIMTVANSDVDVYDCYSSGCSRGVVTVIEGHSIINVRDCHGHASSLHYECEQGGFNGDKTIELNLTDCSTDTTLDINPYHGYFTGIFTNVACNYLTIRTWPPTHSEEGGPWEYDVVTIQDSPDLRTCYAGGDAGIYFPRGVSFNNCTITTTYTPAADNYPAIFYPVYAQYDTYDPGPPATGNYDLQTNGLMTFEDVTFKADPGFTTPVTGFYIVGEDSAANENKTVCGAGCLFHSSLNVAASIPYTAAAYGGWFEFRDCTIDVTNGTGFPIYVGGVNASGAFHLVIDNVTFGPNTTKYLYFSGTPTASCIIELGGVATLDQSKNVIGGTAYGYTFRTLDGLPGVMRRIVGTSAPTNGSTVGFCSNDGTMFDQYYNSTTRLYYKCTSMNPYTWAEYSPGNYSRGSYASLPTTTDDLTSIYTSDEISQVTSNDEVYVIQEGLSNYVIHQYKQIETTVDDIQANITCNLQSTIAPSQSNVVLEVYDTNSDTWVEVDREVSAAADTDFDLAFNLTSGSTPTFENSKDGLGVITSRIWQHAE